MADKRHSKHSKVAHPQSSSTQYDIQLSGDRDTMFYDYHRYKLHKPKLARLRMGEFQYACYVKKCNHRVRIRMTDGGRWVVSKYVMHDICNGRSHSDHHHTLHTPNRQHIGMITKVATQDAILTGKSTRNAAESQMLQNPNLNKLESVASVLPAIYVFF